MRTTLLAIALLLTTSAHAEQVPKMEGLWTTASGRALHFAPAMAAFRRMSEMSDLRLPHELYPQARLMKRKIIDHGGPTNSGKTYQALKRLREADPEQVRTLKPSAGTRRMTAIQTRAREKWISAASIYLPTH